MSWLMVAVLAPVTVIGTSIYQSHPASASFVGSFSEVTAGLTGPQGLALSSDGTTVYVADTAANLIRKVDVATQAMTTLASVPSPHRIAVGPDALYVTSGSTDYSGIPNGERPDALGPDKVVKVAFEGTVSDWTTGLFSPNGIAFDANGDLWVSDEGWTCDTPAHCSGDGGSNVPRMSKAIHGVRQVRRVFSQWDWYSSGVPIAFVGNTMYAAFDRFASRVFSWDVSDDQLVDLGWPATDVAANGTGRGLVTIKDKRLSAMKCGAVQED